MNNTQHVLLTGHSKPDLDELQILLTKIPGIDLETRLMNANHTDPLQQVTHLPDVLLLDLGERGQEMLKALLNRPPATRPIILVVSQQAENPDLMRLAMQVGARDFFRKPVAALDVLGAMRQISRERFSKVHGEHSKLTVLMNAKGGTGASVLACNLAHIMATQLNVRSLLVDMDLQFGSQALNLNLKPEQGLFELLQDIDRLDLVALDVFLCKHASELRLLTRLPGQLGLPGDVPVAKLGQLLDLLLSGFDHVVVDLPRLVDPVMTAFAERADNFIICLEQNVVNLRDAQRLMLILKQELDLASERISIVVNRYQPEAQIQLNDIQQTLNVQTLYCIPNDYKRVVASINLGKPLAESAPNTPITQALTKLAAELCDIQINAKAKGVFGQLFARLAKA